MTLAKDNTGRLTVSGILDIDSANTLREALLNGFLERPEVTLDLSAVDACDTAALQVLLAAQNHATARNAVLRLHAVSPCLLETAAALGVSLEEPAADAGLRPKELS